MEIRNIFSVVPVMLLSIIVTPVRAKVAAKYEAIELPGNGIYVSYAYGISNSGAVYGAAVRTGDGVSGVFRYNVDTGVQEFTDQMCTARDINSSGTLVGTYATRNGQGQYCVWNSDGTVIDLPQMRLPFMEKVHINDSGTVLGDRQEEFSPILQTHYFLWSADSGVRLPALPASCYYWNITDFNNHGCYLGRTSTGWIAPGTPMADQPVLPPLVIEGSGQEYVDALWTEDGAYYEISRSASSAWPEWKFVSDSNQVAGDIACGQEEHVGLWDSVNGVVDLTADLSGGFRCMGLNNLGQVLIAGYTLRPLEPDSVRPARYVWDPEDGLVDLQSLIDPESGWEIGDFRQINDQGYILTTAWNSITHRDVDIVLRPVMTPEPGGILAMLVGFAGLAGLATRRSAHR